jgi:hypothetical protein
VIPSYRSVVLIRFALLVLMRLAAAGLLVSAGMRMAGSVQRLAWFAFNWGHMSRWADRVTNSGVLDIAGPVLAQAALAVVLIFYDRRLIGWLVPVLGLTCPKCGYQLHTGAAEACPECGLRLHHRPAAEATAAGA